MLSKVRYLILPLLAGIALWCSTGISSPDEGVTKDESAFTQVADTQDLALDEGSADEFFGGRGGRGGWGRAGWGGFGGYWPTYSYGYGYPYVYGWPYYGGWGM